MSSSPYKTNDFKALKAAWDKRLKKSGFEDIETVNGELKTYHTSLFNDAGDATLREAKEDYYRHAGYFLNDHKFASELERKIWELHADGYGIRQIVTTLNKRGYHVYKDKIHKILQPLTKEMLKNATKK